MLELLERAYYRTRQFVPASLLHHPQYFMVLRLLERLESGELLDDVLRERLRHILNVSIRDVPFYRSTVKISCDAIKHEDPYEVLLSFPLLDKSTVMSRQREFLNETLNTRWLHYATSGGSTGEGIGLWRNKRLADIERSFFAHEWGRLGFSFERSRYARLGADARAKADEAPTRVFGNALMVSPYHVNERHRAEILSNLRKFRPQFLHGYPSVVSDLSSLVAGEELGFRFRAVLLASEPVTRQQLEDIASVFDCPISAGYGLTERTNLAFARIVSGERPCFRFNSVYGKTENYKHNSHTEIVGTSLWNDVMPLIRYRTQDYGVVDAHGTCDQIEGRLQEFLIDKSGGRIPGLSIVIDEVTWDFVRLYQVQQYEPGRIRIVVVSRSGQLSDEQKRFLIQKQTDRWGSFFDIEIQEVNDISMTDSGKRRLVVTCLSSGT